MFRAIVGFTLLEVLVALAATSFILGAAYRIFAQVTQASQLRADYAEATAIAESLLVGSITGDRNSDAISISPRFTTQIASTPYSVSPALPTQMELTATTAKVRWNHANRERRVELTTVVPTPRY